MKSELDKYVIDKVKQKRKENNVSQRGLAAVLVCSPGFVGQVESDKFPAKYTAHQLYTIARFFDSSVSDFFPDINDPKYNTDF